MQVNSSIPLTQSQYNYVPRQGTPAFNENITSTNTNEKPPRQSNTIFEPKSLPKNNSLRFNPDHRFPMDLNQPSDNTTRSTRPTIFNTPVRKLSFTPVLDATRESLRSTKVAQNINTIENDAQRPKQRIRQVPYSLSPSRGTIGQGNAQYQQTGEELPLPSRKTVWDKCVCCDTHEDIYEESRPIELGKITYAPPVSNQGTLKPQNIRYTPADTGPLPSRFSAIGSLNNTLKKERTFGSTQVSFTRSNIDPAKVIQNAMNDLEYFNKKLPQNNRMEIQRNSPKKFDTFAQMIDSLQAAKKPDDFMNKQELMSVYNTNRSRESGMNFAQPPLKLTVDYPYAKNRVDDYEEIRQVETEQDSHIPAPFLKRDEYDGGEDNDNLIEFKGKPVATSITQQRQKISESLARNPLLSSQSHNKVNTSQNNFASNNDLRKVLDSETSEVGLWSEIPPIHSSILKPRLPKA